MDLIGSMFAMGFDKHILAPGATYAGLPPQFAYPAAFGDLLAALLALAAISFVERDSPGGRLLVWIFNVEGTVDLIAAIALATIYVAPAYMGPAYWIPAFWVPALLVTHYLTFVVLLKYWKNAAQIRAAANPPAPDR